MASNTETVERGSQELSYDVDRTSEQVACQNRAVGTVRPWTTTDEDTDVSFSNRSETDLVAKYAPSMMLSTTGDIVVGFVLGDADCSTDDRPGEVSRVIANITPAVP